MNLAVNARDAIPGSGTIAVVTSEHRIDEDAALAHADLQPGRYVRIAVTDTGSGMTPEVQSQVFEPFFTTKGPGVSTGLGLSTVYAIAKRYGGFVTIYSEVDMGTTIKVYLPATEEEAETQAPEWHGEDGQDTGETVLLVEDEDAVRNACRRILRAGRFPRDRGARRDTGAVGGRRHHHRPAADRRHHAGRSLGQGPRRSHPGVSTRSPRAVHVGLHRRRHLQEGDPRARDHRGRKAVHIVGPAGQGKELLA